MGRLRASNGAWLDDDLEKAEVLVEGLFHGKKEEEVFQDKGRAVIEDTGGFQFSEEKVRGWVIGALSSTNNKWAPGPDGIGYRLIKAVRDTRLGKDLVAEVVGALMEWRIPPRWNEILVVVIPKPGKDLTKINS